MKKNNLFNITTIQNEVFVGNFKENFNHLKKEIEKNKDSFLILTPMMSLTSCFCKQDFNDIRFFEKVKNEVIELVKTCETDAIYTLCVPIVLDGAKVIANIIVYDKKIVGIIPKKEYDKKDAIFKYFDIPTKDKQTIFEGYKTYFGDFILEVDELKICFLMCEDLLKKDAKIKCYAKNGANLVLDITPFTYDPNYLDYMKDYAKYTSYLNSLCYCYLNLSNLESKDIYAYNNDLYIYSLGKKIAAENDKKVFTQTIDLDEVITYRFLNNVKYNKNIEVKKIKIKDSKDFKIYNIEKDPINRECNFQSLIKMHAISILKKIKSLKVIDKVLVGVSGGLDSTLTLLSAAYAYKMLGLGYDKINAIIMPSENTTDESLKDANNLCDLLGVNKRVIKIDEMVRLSNQTIENKEKNIAYENSQARIRTEILTNLSNKENAIMLGTSDLSEIVLGYYTFAGDQISHYSTNIHLSKTTVKKMVLEYIKESKKIFSKDLKDVLTNVVNKDISAELLKNQKTEDVLGLYEINDFIMYHYFKTMWKKEKIVDVIMQLFSLDSKTAENYYDRFKQRYLKNNFKVSSISFTANLFSMTNLSLKDIIRATDDEA